MRLKYSNLISTPTGKGLLGWVSSISWNPVIDMGMFQEKTDLYPKVVTLSLDFNVLHEGNVGWQNGVWSGRKTFPFTGDIK